MGGQLCRNLWCYSASFIDVVEAGKFPAAFGLFKNEADRCVFPVVWSLLEGAIDLVSPCRFFLRLPAPKTLGGIGFAFENFVIPAQEILLVLYGLHPVWHREREFRHLRDCRFIASDHRGFKLVPECRKIGLRKCVGKKTQS